MPRGWNNWPRWQRLTFGNRKNPLPDRTVEIVWLRLQGVKFRDIGEIYGITVERVRQLYYGAIVGFWSAMERENYYEFDFLCIVCGEPCTLEEGKICNRCYTPAVVQIVQDDP